MTTIILVPGGGGSRLSLNGQEIWPPDFWEMSGGYQRINELQDPDVVATGLFEVYPPGSFIYCQDVYLTLKSDLDHIASTLGYQRLDFYFDWRLDVRVSADQLATRIASFVANGMGPVILVCHSMGNLLARWILESGNYSSTSWFNSVSLYLGICGPHFGTPENLEYVAGDKGFLCISPADTKTLSANHNYPGPGYQCLPFQTYPTPVLYDTQTGPESFYDATVAAQLGLDWTNLQTAVGLQQYLGFNRMPAHTQYALIAASGESTDEALVYDQDVFEGASADDQGDGTIPLASAKQLNARVTPGSHIDVLHAYPFRVILYEILTGPSAAALAPQFTLGDVPGITVCLNKYVVAPNEPLEILLVPDLETTEIKGTLRITRIKEPGARPVIVQRQNLAYKGPPIQVLRTTLKAPEEPGGYQISVGGKQGTSQSTAVGFAVSKLAQMPTRPKR